ncbi:MAG: N-acetylmuramoyl-L-alanine amidase [Candidatus Sericytochromatia bacterium]|nr:N-acetylmuramoyl-L-alanine amidase [Candidatus Sericytochromatia bacterium]
MPSSPSPRPSSLARRGLSAALALACALAWAAPEAGANTATRARDAKQKAGVPRAATSAAPSQRPAKGHAGAPGPQRRGTPAGRGKPARGHAPRPAGVARPASKASRGPAAKPKPRPVPARPQGPASRTKAPGPPRGTAAKAVARPASPVVKPAPEPLVIEDLAWRRYGLVLQTSAAFKPAISVLDRPHRFVIDLPAAEFADPALKRTIQVAQAGIRQVRMAKHGTGVRIVLDCEAAPSFQVMQLRDRSMLVVARAGQEDPGLKALIERFSDEEPDDPLEGQQLAGVWAKEAGDRLTLHVGLSGSSGLRYQLFQAQPHQLRLRVPGGAYPGALPPTSRLLRKVEASRQGNAWILEVTLAEGYYDLSEDRDEAGGITLVWERVEPRTRPGMPLVVIDPGHGGVDPGAVGPTGRTEKAVCLGLARSLRDTLRRRGYNAILTRSVDAEVHLAPRLATIARWQADMFVSLHANSHSSHEANGLETYWREPGSRAFAETVHRTVATLLRRPDRGTKQDNLYVLRHASVPSLLLETGFISNPVEERWLDDATHQGQAAFAIAAGIENFRASPLVGSRPGAGALRPGDAFVQAMWDCRAP